MRPLQILLVEPDPDRRHAFVELLRSAGHQVLAVEDVRLAAESLAAEPGRATPAFEALVLDLAVPGLDLAALRASLAPAAPAVPDTLEAAERRQIALVLAHTNGNRRQAAHLLGVARSTLLNKIRRYGLT